MFAVKNKGDFKKTDKFFNRALKRSYIGILDAYAQRGIEALRNATPRDSGETAESWKYDIENNDGYTSINFSNSHEENGSNIAILLIYGHGTKNGGYVQGNDFVSPALLSVFQELADKIWMEVTRGNG